jgi:hypothetical protein
LLEDQPTAVARARPLLFFGGCTVAKKAAKKTAKKASTKKKAAKKGKK